MKNITKRIIAVMAVLCVAAAGFTSCGDKNKTPEKDGNVSAEDMKFPLQFGEAGDGNSLADGVAQDLIVDDPTGAEEPATEIVTEIQDVTDADGQPVTEVQDVTEADGSKVTDANGAVVTETVKVTTVVSSTVTVAPTTAAYKAKTDRRYAMWLDVSQDENFHFEGDFLKATFKIKKNAPDGDYKVRLTTDLSDIAGKVVYPDKVIDGVIKVNNGSASTPDMSSESGLVFYCDNVAAKQGDTVDFYFYVKNNPGLAAFICWFYFDSNAMEFVSASASGEYEEVARSTEIGAGKYNNSFND